MEHLFPGVCVIANLGGVVAGSKNPIDFVDGFMIDQCVYVHGTYHSRTAYDTVLITINDAACYNIFFEFAASAVRIRRT